VGGVDVPAESIQLVAHKAQRFELAHRPFGPGARGFFSDRILGLLHRFAQQADILERSLDTIERCALVSHDARILSCQG